MLCTVKFISFITPNWKLCSSSLAFTILVLLAPVGEKRQHRICLSNNKSAFKCVYFSQSPCDSNLSVWSLLSWLRHCVRVMVATGTLVRWHLQGQCDISWLRYGCTGNGKHNPKTTSPQPGNNLQCKEIWLQCYKWWLIHIKNTNAGNIWEGSKHN